MIVLARLQIRQMLHGAKGVTLALIGFGPLALTLAFSSLGGLDASYDPDFHELSTGIFLLAIYAQFTCIVASLFYGTLIISSELDWKTLTYLFTRPIPKWKVVVGKYLGVLSILVPTLVASAALSFLVVGAPFGLRGLLATVATVAVATVTYTSIFAAIGVLVPRRAVAVGLMYGAVFEWALTYVPALINKITVTYYIRGLAYELAAPMAISEFADEGFEVGLLPAAGLWPSLIGPLAITAIALVITCVIVRSRTYTP